MMKSFKVFKTMMFVIVVGLLLCVNVSCGGDNKVTNTPVATELVESWETDVTPELEAIPEETPEKNTDEQVVEQDGQEEKPFVMPVKGQRPYAVMIDNSGSGCLPQGGVDQAQVVYEMLVEGGYSRMMALYWGVQPELVGPVRSARHYFLDYSMENDAVYVHFGWSPQALRDISKLKINNINGVKNSGGIFFDLTKNKKNWQDSYTTGEKIIAYANKSGYRTETKKDNVFQYTDGAIAFENKKNAKKILIQYSASYRCSYQYHEESQRYERFRKDVPHVERTTGQAFKVKNILVQYVKNRTIKGDNEGRQELDTVGSGKGWLISGGVASEIKWSKKSREAATKYTFASGSPIQLMPGSTWVQIVPIEGKVTIES